MRKWKKNSAMSYISVYISRMYLSSSSNVVFSTVSDERGKDPIMYFESVLRSIPDLFH